MIGVLTQSRAPSDSEDDKRCYPASLHYSAESKELLTSASEDGPDVIYSPRRSMGVSCGAGCVACNGAAVLEGNTFGHYGRLGRPPSSSLLDPAVAKYKVQNIEMSDFRTDSATVNGNAEANNLAAL